MDGPKYEATFSMKRIGQFQTLKEACECVIKRIKEENLPLVSILFESIWIDAIVPAAEIPAEESAASTPIPIPGRVAWFWDQILEVSHKNGWMNNEGWIDEGQVMQSTFDF